MRALICELTPREREVATLVAKGLENKEIAWQLHIGLSTVKTHVERVLQKTGAHNRAHLAAFVSAARPYEWLEAPY